MASCPAFHDIAHLGHVELLTPKPEESLAFFTDIVGLHEVLYCYEPRGNRFEIASGGYLIFDPDWKPVVWSEAERANG